jgi:hypothetical protein
MKTKKKSCMATTPDSLQVLKLLPDNHHLVVDDLKHDAIPKL